MVKRYRSYSVEFKLQVVREFSAGETLSDLARRYEMSRNLVRKWARKYEEGAGVRPCASAESTTRNASPTLAPP